MTPMNVALAFSPVIVTSVPRCSSSSGSSGTDCPMLSPNTVTEVIAAARLHRRVRIACDMVSS